MKKTLLPEIYHTAIQASIEASAVILPIYENDIHAEIKSDGSPVTKADLAASEVIAAMLEPTGIPILGEELDKQPFSLRETWTENWCVDPLDGTKMFLMKNDEFSINIAHIVNGKSVFGIIASPIQQEIIVGGPSFGAHIFSFSDAHSEENWQHLHPISTINNPLIVTCSRSFSEEQELKLKTLVDLKNHSMNYLAKGSALKFFDLARGSADIYPRFAPTMEWDIAAGQAILEALGGTVVDAYTSEALRYNKESLYNPHFIARTNAML